MLRTLLICGLLAGLCGGLLATGFAELAGEPPVDQAIAFEERAQAARRRRARGRAGARLARPPEERRPADRRASSTALALGGLFALAFAFAYGRVGRGASPARTALWLAAAAFVVVYLVPFLKYPANPPSVGDPDTIGKRTALYLSMVGDLGPRRGRRGAAARRRWPSAATRSTATARSRSRRTSSSSWRRGWRCRASTRSRRNFPATTLWRFREASVGMQAVMWATIGLVFAAAARSG